MAWCMNIHCGKQNLRKDDVEFDDELKMVLCHGCYALRHPGWMPPVEVVNVVPPQRPEWNYELRLTSQEGLQARVGYGDITIAFHAPMEELRRLFEPHERQELHA